MAKSKGVNKVDLDRQRELRSLIMADLEAIMAINGREAAKHMAVAQIYYSAEWLTRHYERSMVMALLEIQLKNLEDGRW